MAESGDETAIDLECIDILSVPALKFPAGADRQAFVAMFLTFRDGEIISQRNYDCYPLGVQPDPVISGCSSGASDPQRPGPSLAPVVIFADRAITLQDWDNDIFTAHPSGG